MTTCDALVIGAGYYGCRIALRLRELGLGRVLIVDRESGIMKRASFGNQARIHNGYHYPRAPITASSSRRNFARFVEEHSYAVDFGLTNLYGIAHGSRVNPNQFERFCGDIGASLRPLAPHALRLFDPDMVEAVYEVEELVFDAKLIAQRMEQALAQANIDLRLSCIARIAAKGRPMARVEVNGQGVDAALVFNCTYADLDTVGVPLRAPLRREWAEMALVEPPRDLQGIGVTIMDGPFFSVIPFPPLGCYSLTHVRFTPVAAWLDASEEPDLPVRWGVGRPTNGMAMIRDACRYLPCMRQAELRASLYEIKTVLTANDDDDGRPILFERCADSPNIISVLGGKMDNIFDILHALEEEIECGATN